MCAMMMLWKVPSHSLMQIQSGEVLVDEKGLRVVVHGFKGLFNDGSHGRW